MKKFKKGFTIVELVIVIAVIAILAAVLIPTFSSIVHNARVSSDKQIVRNLNTALNADEVMNGKPLTMHDALMVAEEAGYNVEKINASATDNEILWNSKANVFCYLNNGTIEYIPNTSDADATEADLWVISDTDVDETYSTYYTNNDYVETLNAVDGLGIDVSTANVGKVIYKGTSSNVVTIRTNGCNLEVENNDATVYWYGTAGLISIIGVDNEQCFHANGSAEIVAIKQGRFVAESTATIKVLAIDNNADAGDVTGTVKLVNNGGVIETAFGGKNDANVNYGIEVDYKQVGTEIDEIVATAIGSAYFAGGNGTEANPYLIENAEQFKNISAVYEDDFKFFKVKEDHAIIDAKDLGIFGTAGTGKNDADENQVVIENFTVNFVGGFGVVRVCGAKDLLFKNVNVTGYLLCDWNAGAFLRYGTRNIHSTGFDYVVGFETCSSVAEIYSTSNAYSAILVGHPYPGEGTATINVDAYTDANINDTKLYYTGSDKVPFGYKYSCINSATVYVDGVETKNDKITTNVVAVSTKLPAKDNSGNYVITTEEDTAKVVITLNFQYSLYTNGTYSQAVEGSTGVGGMLETSVELGSIGNEQIEVLGKIDSFEVVTGADKFDYELKDGKLTIYVKGSNSNIDGWVTLNVEQFTSGSNIAKYKGSLRIVERITKGNPSVIWTIK